jgi:hypothetical protein
MGEICKLEIKNVAVSTVLDVRIDGFLNYIIIDSSHDSSNFLIYENRLRNKDKIST